MIRPDVEFAYEAEARLGPAVAQGAAPDGERRYIPILGGRFKGPRLEGEILPGGADWQVTRPDGVLLLDAIYAMRTGDGAVIQVRNRGMRSGPPEVMAALARGERIDPTSIYFRTSPQLTAPAGPHDWLNRSLFLCTGERWADGIRLWVWQVV
ncbi:DUF3237 domain-containing protein [Sphingosinicella terrae]|uniref:DUF3237 domain-containing protein n=1 Tax=Sphingosinicella terrae TaxID=2172047 RepID=UPI000E0D38BC|nr:DUF3237 domain-containing protein [Sphingosinicella terrae]